MRLYDTHCHLQDGDFDADRAEVLARMQEAGVTLLNLIGSDREGNAGAVRLAESLPGAYAAVGIHPHHADQWGEDVRREMASQLSLGKTVALGEIGLDYHYDFHPRELQRRALAEQLEWAQALDMPVIFHVREAFGDFLPMIRGRTIRGVMHCYAGSRESAKICLDAGLFISFTGSVTFKNAHNLREAALYVPRDRILVETDAPYLAPVPHRGKRNEPAFVRDTALFLADLRGEDAVEACERMFQNGCACFGVMADESKP